MGQPDVSCRLGRAAAAESARESWRDFRAGGAFIARKETAFRSLRIDQAVVHTRSDRTFGSASFGGSTRSRSASKASCHLFHGPAAELYFGQRLSRFWRVHGWITLRRLLGWWIASRGFRRLWFLGGRWRLLRLLHGRGLRRLDGIQAGVLNHAATNCPACGYDTSAANRPATAQRSSATDEGSACRPPQIAGALHREVRHGGGRCKPQTWLSRT